VARALGLRAQDLWFDYFGLNHLGWLKAVLDASGDRLPGLLADDAAMATFEEGRLFGANQLRTLGMIPNEYLVYYYAGARIVDTLAHRGFGRADFLAQQQATFYACRSSGPVEALETWRATTNERERTYLAEGRSADASVTPLVDTDEGQGYALVATQLIEALQLNLRPVMILNTANRGSLPGLDATAVVEVPCVVSSAGVIPVVAGEPPGHALELMTRVKEVERTTIEAAVTGSSALAIQALARHPLVPSLEVAQRIFASYLDLQPVLRQQFA
jgi:6-phospho-beta-glucosidase